MTIEEAKSCIGTIEMLQRLAYNIHGVMDVVDADNCKNIIEALEQEPCDDCISRQAVLEVLKKNRYRFNISQEEYCEGKVLWSENLIKDDACKEIKALPSVTPKEKTAAWVPVDAEPRDIYECNACGWLLYYEDRTDFKYCPNCGAKMQEVENDT